MKDIFGYEGLYAITSCGKVWSYKSKRFLKPEILPKGYLRVNLYKNGKMTHHLIHRLVAMAYIPNPNELPHVGHDDDIPSHNWVNNLYWTDFLENNNHGNRIEKAAQKHKKQVKQMTLNGDFIKLWDGCVDAEKALGIKSIYRAANGSRKSAGGYRWEYC